VETQAVQLAIGSRTIEVVLGDFNKKVAILLTSSAALVGTIRQRAGSFIVPSSEAGPMAAPACVPTLFKTA
jgi:hypothetical protein